MGKKTVLLTEKRIRENAVKTNGNEIPSCNGSKKPLTPVIK